MARKSTQIYISCTSGGRKLKIKARRNFEVKYSFLFFRNLEILDSCCDIIISELDQTGTVTYTWQQKY